MYTGEMIIRGRLVNTRVRRRRHHNTHMKKGNSTKAGMGRYNENISAGEQRRKMKRKAISGSMEEKPRVRKEQENVQATNITRGMDRTR